MSTRSVKRIRRAHTVALVLLAILHGGPGSASTDAVSRAISTLDTTTTVRVESRPVSIFNAVEHARATSRALSILNDGTPFHSAADPVSRAVSVDNEGQTVTFSLDLRGPARRGLFRPDLKMRPAVRVVGYASQPMCDADGDSIWTASVRLRAESNFAWMFGIDPDSTVQDTTRRIYERSGNPRTGAIPTGRDTTLAAVSFDDSPLAAAQGDWGARAVIALASGSSPPVELIDNGYTTYATLAVSALDRPALMGLRLYGVPIDTTQAPPGIVTMAATFYWGLEVVPAGANLTGTLTFPDTVFGQIGDPAALRVLSRSLGGSWGVASTTTDAAARKVSLGFSGPTMAGPTEHTLGSTTPGNRFPPELPYAMVVTSGSLTKSFSGGDASLSFGGEGQSASMSTTYSAFGGTATGAFSMDVTTSGSTVTLSEKANIDWPTTTFTGYPYMHGSVNADVYLLAPPGTPFSYFGSGSGSASGFADNCGNSNGQGPLTYVGLSGLIDGVPCDGSTVSASKPGATDPNPWSGAGTTGGRRAFIAAPGARYSYAYTVGESQNLSLNNGTNENNKASVRGQAAYTYSTSIVGNACGNCPHPTVLIIEGADRGGNNDNISDQLHTMTCSAAANLEALGWTVDLVDVSCEPNPKQAIASHFDNPCIRGLFMTGHGSYLESGPCQTIGGSEKRGVILTNLGGQKCDRVLFPSELAPLLSGKTLDFVAIESCEQTYSDWRRAIGRFLAPWGVISLGVNRGFDLSHPHADGPDGVSVFVNADAEVADVRERAANSDFVPCSYGARAGPSAARRPSCPIVVCGAHGTELGRPAASAAGQCGSFLECDSTLDNCGDALYPPLSCFEEKGQLVGGAFESWAADSSFGVEAFAHGVSGNGVLTVATSYSNVPNGLKITGASALGVWATVASAGAYGSEAPDSVTVHFHYSSLDSIGKTLASGLGVAAAFASYDSTAAVWMAMQHDPARRRLSVTVPHGGFIGLYRTTHAVDAVGPGNTRGLSFAVGPNPARNELVISVRGLDRATGGAVDIAVFDLFGRAMFRTVRHASGGDGVIVSRWDLRDRAGAEVKSGMYYVKLRVGAKVVVRSVVVLR